MVMLVGSLVNGGHEERKMSPEVSARLIGQNIEESMMASVQTDPICGMELEETEEVLLFQHKGKIYYFCSLECYRKFCAMVEETSNGVEKVDVLAKGTDSNEGS